MSSILDALRRIEREEGGNPQIYSPQFDTGVPGGDSRLGRIRIGAAVAVALTGSVALVLWLSGTRVLKDESAEQPPSSADVQLAQVAPVVDQEGSDLEHGRPTVKTGTPEEAPPLEAVSAAGIPGPGGKDPGAGPPDGVGRRVGPEPTIRAVTDEQKTTRLPDTAVAKRRSAALPEGVPAGSRQPTGRLSSETDGEARQLSPAPSSAIGSPAKAASEPTEGAPTHVSAARSAKRPARSLGDSGLRERFAAKLAERMEDTESPASPLDEPSAVANTATPEVSPAEVRPSEPTILPPPETPLNEAKLDLRDSHVRSEEPPPSPKGSRQPDGQSNRAEEEVLRRRPPGAPYVRVSFLFYSSEPTRRRVMVTVNDGSLVTLFEGQATDDLEVERILRDEVHFRYQGKLFAVRPRG